MPLAEILATCRKNVSNTGPWPFVRGINRWPVNSPHKGQRRGALMFSLICARINGWANNREAGDLRRYRAHYGATVMSFACSCWAVNMFRDITSIGENFCFINERYWSRFDVFQKTILSIKLVYGHDGGCRSKHICLHHTHNRIIAVLNNAQILIIQFTLKKSNWFCQLSPYNIAIALQQRFSQSKLITKVWESTYPTIKLRSWCGHYPITPVTVKALLEKQIWLGYTLTLQPIEISSRKSFYV